MRKKTHKLLKKPVFIVLSRYYKQLSKGRTDMGMGYLKALSTILATVLKLFQNFKKFIHKENM